MINKWDDRFMQLAEVVSTWSKDPSTKVGAVITKNKRVISLGFNGFATGVGDHTHRYEDREFKYPAILHAEVNALLFAKSDLQDCTIYTYPMPPCAQCAAKIIQTGIKKVISIRPSKELMDRWGKDMSIANSMYADAGVSLTFMGE